MPEGFILKLSSRFFITLAIYVAFQIIGYLSPILEISQLIVPIFVLIMLEGRELALFIGIRCCFMIAAMIRLFPSIKDLTDLTFLIANITGDFTMTRQELENVMTIYMAIMPFVMIAIHYLGAYYVIRKKKIRERIGKMLH